MPAIRKVERDLMELVQDITQAEIGQSNNVETAASTEAPSGQMTEKNVTDHFGT